MPLGARLKELRLRRGQSLQEVATAVGASKGHIWGLETAQTKNPSMDLLLQLARHFNVSLEELLQDEVGAQDDPEDVVAMYRDLKTLNEDDLRIMKSVLESIKAKGKSKDK